MKLIDWLVIVAFFACLGIVYAGFRLEGALASIVVLLVGSWRFYDRSREKHMLHGASGDNLPDHPDSMYSGSSFHSDSGSDGGSASTSD